MTEEHFVAVISEVNMVGNDNEWWIDIGATRHVSYDKTLFKTFVHEGDVHELYMGNSSIPKVGGYGRVDLNLSSGKLLTLNEVLYAPEIRKKSNLC